MKLLLLLFFLAGCCQKQELSVFTEYVSLETLPSYRIGTPDPRLYCPDYGQKLHIKWSVPATCLIEELDLALHISIRFGNKEDSEQWLTLHSFSGIYVYPLLNDDYWTKEGILTFKIELYSQGEVIQEWRHQLWAERIQLTP